MPVTSTISLNVTPLTDNEIAFANAAAWNNYFNNLDGVVTLDPIAVSTYGGGSYDTTQTYHQMTVDSEIWQFPTKDQFDSLANAFNALQASYVTLRAELYAAGLIDNP